MAWYWIVAIGLGMLAAGCMIGGTLGLHAIRSAAKSADPICAMGEWVYVVPVWKLDSDRLYHEVDVLGRMAHAIRDAKKQLEDLFGGKEELADDLNAIIANPDQADGDDAADFAAFVKKVDEAMATAGLNAIS